MSGDVERVAVELARDLHECGVCRDLSWSTHDHEPPGPCITLAHHLLAPGGVVAGMVRDAAIRGAEAARADWRDARRDGAAEVRARVEAVLVEYDRIDRLVQRSSIGATGPTLVQRIRVALADPGIAQNGPETGLGDDGGAKAAPSVSGAQNGAEGDSESQEDE
jgi:hypothetical protein